LVLVEDPGQVTVTWVILTEAALRFAKTTTLLATALAGSAFLVTGGGASAAQEDSATGGGQILFSEDGTGPGNTLAFTARGTSEIAKGQVQYVNREAGTGQDQTVEHGTVSCIDAQAASEDSPAFAKISGTWRNGKVFDLYVEDGGQGADSAGDFVTFIATDDTEPDCDFNAPDEQMELARGNAQVRDGDAG
jgi:hypothetical protein